MELTIPFFLGIKVNLVNLFCAVLLTVKIYTLCKISYSIFSILVGCICIVYHTVSSGNSENSHNQFIMLKNPV